MQIDSRTIGRHEVQLHVLPPDSTIRMRCWRVVTLSDGRVVRTSLFTDVAHARLHFNNVHMRLKG